MANSIISDVQGYLDWLLLLATDIHEATNGHLMLGIVKTNDGVTMGAFDNWKGYPRLLDITDDIAPATPTGFTATPILGQYRLTWDANQETDLQGYHLKYKIGNDGEWLEPVPVNSDGSNILLGTYFIFTEVPANITCYFYLTAVDKAGNESQPTETLSETSPIPPLTLWSDDGTNTYLGKVVSNQYDLDGIFNDFGTYGSKYSIFSIWNTYGTYGSEFSIYSAFNDYTISPPIIKDAAGRIVGRLTTNEYVFGAVDPNGLQQTLIELGY